VPEGRRRLAEILALPRAAGRTLARAWILRMAGRLAHQQAGTTGAEALFQESLAIYEELGSSEGQMQCWYDLASLARDRGDTARARALYEAALARAREAGYEFDIALALRGLGCTAFLGGDLDGAHALLEEALRILRREAPFAWTR